MAHLAALLLPLAFDSPRPHAPVPVLTYIKATLGLDEQKICNTDEHHPENDGYYIEGVAGIDNTIETDETGRRSANTTWAKDTYYPHGEAKLCEGVYCGPVSSRVPQPQYLYAHTCALLRFSYLANEASTVYELPSQQALDECDFSDATLLAAEDAGDPYFDHQIEADVEVDSYLYFASIVGCQSGQKVAVYVSGDYAVNYEQCYAMGLDSSRVENCDCDFKVSPSTLVDPCHTGFHDGCMASMPEDLSCCDTGTCEPVVHEDTSSC